MVFIFVIILTFFISQIFRKKIKNIFIRIVTSYFIAGIIISFFTFGVCSDGWRSVSIGAQGACSHHGGVTAKLNATGILLFFICLFVLAINALGLLKLFQEKNRKKFSLHENDICGKFISKSEYIYRTEFRTIEKSIKESSLKLGVKYKINHEIKGKKIVANFKFQTEKLLNDVIKAAKQ